MKYYKIKLDKELDMFDDPSGRGTHVSIPVEWVEIKCSICGREAFRIEGLIGGVPELKKQNESITGVVIFCNRCIKDGSWKKLK
jgi:hypothetical protein